LFILLLVILGWFATGNVLAAVVPGQVVVKQGDALGPSFVSVLNTPFTDGNGKVGFVGSLTDAERFIWWDTGAVFFSNDALPDVLTGGESTMGVSNTGGFIYSPSFNGNDAVYTHGGKLLAKGDACPPLPGLYSSFNSRPTMLPDGTAYWVGGTSTTPGGTTTNRHLLKATDPTDSTTIVRVLGGGDVIEGKTIKTTASNFDYWISDNGLHHIHVLDMDVTLNEHVYLDGAFVAQEGGPTGQGDNWATFDIVGVNNSGNYIFTGDTDGDVASDEFLVYNGVIEVREGDTLDGVTIVTGSTFRAAAINNLNEVAHMWGSSTDEHLFWGVGGDLANSVHLLAVGDSVDVDEDFVPDYIVTDFNASTAIGPGLDLGDDGRVYLSVDLSLLDGTAVGYAILGLNASPPSSVDQRPAGSLTGTAALYPSSPNPFTTGTTVRYELRRTASLRLSIFDVAGRCVRVLAAGSRGAGPHECVWDGSDGSGVALPAGSYYLRLEVNGAETPQRLILIR